MDNFKKSVLSLYEAIKKAGIIDWNENTREDFTDFKAQKGSYLRKAVETNLQAVKNYASELQALTDQPDALKIQDIVKNLALDGNLEKSVKEIIDLMEDLKLPQSNILKLRIPYIPLEIKADVNADIQEMQKSFDVECYRSATILCGRILEAALHRKYYETTGHDILEKNPGIGLGKLIAKLSEKNVKFDPGLTQQIHLINQVRVFSVHTKKEAFYPSKAQTHAMILYTMDVLEKLFAK